MTADQANDEILAVFKAAWDTTGLGVTYTDVPAEKPNSEVGWARVTVIHEDGGQSGFSPTEVKKYTNTGMVATQVFGPKGDGGAEARRLAQLVLVAYSQARGSVWYRKQHIKDVGSSGSWHQINIIAHFTYDDQR